MATKAASYRAVVEIQTAMSSSLDQAGDLLSYGQIVLFGDSITEWSFSTEWTGYGAALAHAYTRKLDVINRGFSGYNTRQARDLVKRIFPARRDDVKVVVLFFGANDAVLPGNIQHIPMQEFTNNLREILSSDVLVGKVIAVTPPPIEEHSHKIHFGAIRTAESTRDYGKAIKETCQGLGVPVADVWESFMTKIGHTGGNPAPGGLNQPKNEQLAAYFMDGLHPLTAGYRIIYETIFGTLCSSFPHLAPSATDSHTPLWESAVQPRPGQVIRWCIDTAPWTEAEYDRLLGRVPQADILNIEKFHFMKDRRMALGSVLLQRHFASRILGRPLQPQESIARDDNNRPYYVAKSIRRNDFNVSHHCGIVALAGIVEGNRVGIDVTSPESLRPGETVSQYLDSFKESFSESEWRCIDGDMKRFAQHWALKEAYVKATGTGITIDLTTIEFRHVVYVDSEAPVQERAGDLWVRGESCDWTFELHYNGDTYIAISHETLDNRHEPIDRFTTLTAEDFTRTSKM